MTRAVGIDISKYDISFHPTPFVEFVTMRASYGGYSGGTWLDPKFEAFYPQSLAVPVRGAYHYMSSHSNWKEQADKFLGFVAGKKLDYYACDIEVYYNTMSKAFITGCFDWMDYVKQNTTTKVILYSNPHVYNTYITPYAGARAAKYNFWIAQYWLNWQSYQTNQPGMPKGRTDWHIWQFIPGEWGHYGKETGVGRDGVDMNVFNGTLDEMKTWLRPTSTPDTPAEVDAIEFMVTVSALNIRYQPSATAQKVGYFVYGNTFRISGTTKDSYGNIWGKIKDNTFVALKYNGYYYTTWREGLGG